MCWLIADPLRDRCGDLAGGGPHVTGRRHRAKRQIPGLKRARSGVVDTEPRGRFTFYRLVPEALQGAALHLADLAASARANSANFRTC